MTNTNDTREYFEVNFKDNPDVRPETVKAGDIADILQTIESMVESKVFLANPQVKKDQIIVGFTNIRASSVDLQFYSPFKEITKNSFQDIGIAIKNKDFSTLPIPAYKTCNVISSFSKKYKCNAEFVHQNGRKIVLAVITPNTQIQKPPSLRGETTIYAKVVRVGGKEPKVEIETIDGITLFCDASLDVTTKLGTKLYQTVGLAGIAKWDYALNNVEEFSIKDVTEYERIPIKQTINELAKIASEYYTNITDVNKYISELRGSE